MRSQIYAAALIATVVLGSIFSISAFETDQYDLPPEPLADIGDEVSAHVDEAILAAIQSVNAEIELHASCLEASPGKGTKCGTHGRESQQLNELRSPDAVADAVYKRLGDGDLFTTITGKWFDKHKFAREPSRYKPPYRESIFLSRPINYLTLSPTVRMYGSEFGFDKIDHFFQQGYRYYRKYKDAVAAGKSPAVAAEKAVSWGRMTERTYFGSLVSGVYSNGDLFANYAGMKFYQGLTSEITINGGMLPPLVVLKENKWALNEDTGLKPGTLRPFIADNLNEALNPSGYSYFLYKIVEKVVRSRSCKQWRARYPNATAEEFRKRSANLETWNGEDYGFTRKSKSVPIAICFEDKLPAQ